MKLSLLSLILFCFSLFVTSKLQTRRPDKYSYMLSQLSQPYTNVFKLFHDRANDKLNYLKTYLEKSIKKQDNSEDEALHIVIGTDSNAQKNNINQSLDNGDIAIGRILDARTCVNGGQAVDVRVNVYICSGQEVAKAEYVAKNGEDCTITTETKSVCYCPFDFYGDTCQKPVVWTCEIDRLSHPDDCTGRDTFTYVYSYNGAPPCYPVLEGQKVTMATRAICRYEDTKYAFEGVKDSKYEVLAQPDLGAIFTYQVDGTQFKLTSMPSSMLVISFTNWKKMSLPATYTTSLDASQLAGNSIIITDITFSSYLVTFARTGRFYYEIFIHSNEDTMNANYCGGYFEQIGYEEPLPTDKSSKTLVVVWAILGALIILSLIVGYNFHQKRKLRRVTVTDVDPLIDDE